MSAAFHAYPSSVHSYLYYARTVPLKADVVEFDRSGEYDPVNFCFTADSAKIMTFNFNLLWQAVPDLGYMTPLFFRKPAGWTDLTRPLGIEIAGTDLVARAYSNAGHNQGQMLSRTVELEEGDSVFAVPCNAFGASSFPLTNAVSGDGVNTCNYFEGFEV